MRIAATEHLLGEGITAEQINDDRIGKVLDDLQAKGLSEIFVGFSMKGVEKYGVKVETGHVDSTSQVLKNELFASAYFSFVRQK